ncbi:MAG: hypothetical protein ABIH37_02635 [archaeon]
MVNGKSLKERIGDSVRLIVRDLEHEQRDLSIIFLYNSGEEVSGVFSMKRLLELWQLRGRTRRGYFRSRLVDELSHNGKKPEVYWSAECQECNPVMNRCDINCSAYSINVSHYINGQANPQVNP